MKFIKQNLDILFAGFLLLSIFLFIMFRLNSDLPAHASYAIKCLAEGHLFSSNFLMYCLANLISGFSGIYSYVRVSLAIIITAACLAKYIVVRNELSVDFTTLQARLMSASLLFVYILPLPYFLKIFSAFVNTDTMYLDYYAPNVWHNSTILCMMPFAIAIYFLSVKQFKNFSHKSNIEISLLLIFSSLIKPSFTFIYIIAYPIIIFSKYRLKKEFAYSIVPVLVGILCCIYIFISTYDGHDNSSVIGNRRILSISFWQTNIIYLISSATLPILFFILFRNTIKHDFEFWFIILMMICAIAIAWCFRETGPRAGDGNLRWQVIPAMWFMYYYMLKIVMQNRISINEASGINKGTPNKRTTSFFLSLYICHVFVGLFYLGRFLLLNNYF